MNFNLIYPISQIIHSPPNPIQKEQKDHQNHYSKDSNFININFLLLSTIQSNFEVNFQLNSLRFHHLHLQKNHHNNLILRWLVRLLYYFQLLYLPIFSFILLFFFCFLLLYLGLLLFSASESLHLISFNSFPWLSFHTTLFISLEVNCSF